jgi:hypothetical protein
MLNDVSYVRGVVTQGGNDNSVTSYVTSYQVLYRQDGDEWQPASGQDAIVTVSNIVNYGVYIGNTSIHRN